MSTQTTRELDAPLRSNPIPLAQPAWRIFVNVRKESWRGISNGAADLRFIPITLRLPPISGKVS